MPAAAVQGLGFLGVRVVDDADATRAAMQEAGVVFLWDTQREGGRAWAHYRGPDGAVYELIGPSVRS